MSRRPISLMVVLALSLVVSLAPAAVSQDDGALDLVPVELDAFGVMSVAPAAWTEQPGGRFPRGAPPDDLAQIVMQAAPISTELLWPNLVPSLGLLDASGNTDFETLVLPDANHLLQAALSGAVSEYGELASEFTPDLLPALVEWVTERASAP